MTYIFLYSLYSSLKESWLFTGRKIVFSATRHFLTAAFVRKFLFTLIFSMGFFLRNFLSLIRFQRCEVVILENFGKREREIVS